MGPDDLYQPRPEGPPSGRDRTRRWGSAMTRQQAMLVINPIADATFASACDEAMRSHPEDPDELQARLRPDYPSVVVRPRALSGETTSIWYVYRDGHWVSSA